MPLPLIPTTIIGSLPKPGWLSSEWYSVVERWKLIDNGEKLEVTYTVDDPDAFNQPWSAVRQYRRVQQPMLEEVCAENNQHLFNYHIPVADKPDF